MLNFYKDINLVSINNEIININSLKINDQLYNNTITNVTKEYIQYVDIFTDLNHFIVGNTNQLLVYNNDQQLKISVQDYLDQNLCYKMKIVPIENNNEYSYVNAYYAGFDHIFEYLLNKSIKTRQHVLAGLIDSLSISYIENGIQLHINSDKLKNKIIRLLQSLGYVVFIKQNDINVLGDFSNIPVKENKSVNYINYQKSYVNFSIIPQNKKELCYSLQTTNSYGVLNNGIEILL